MGSELHDALSHIESAIDDLKAYRQRTPENVHGAGVLLDLVERLGELRDQIEAEMDLPNDETPPEAA